MSSRSSDSQELTPQRTKLNSESRRRSGASAKRGTRGSFVLRLGRGTAPFSGNQGQNIVQTQCSSRVSRSFEVSPLTVLALTEMLKSNRPPINRIILNLRTLPPIGMTVSCEEKETDAHSG